MATGESGETILGVRELSVSFRMYAHGLRQELLPVITGLNLSTKASEILAVVGSSGSGKSLLAHAILGILPGNASVSGEIRYRGQPLTADVQQRLRGREIALVPQSVEYLDPLMRVGRQVIGHGGDKELLRSTFARYGLSEAVEKMYLHQLSGGMARRVLTSTAVVSGARLIVADEPTPGLDRELAEVAMGDFRALASQGCSVLLITHDIDLALSCADRVAVFYAGTTVEIADVADFAQVESLRHPYSKALWQAMPQNGFIPTKGSQPYPGSITEGCLFAARCDQCTDECLQKRPAMRALRGGEVSCFHAA